MDITSALCYRPYLVLYMNTTSHSFSLFQVDQKQISECLSIQTWLGLWNSLALDNNYSTTKDIWVFFCDGFKSIKTTHPMKQHIPLTWPGSSIIEKLVHKSSGQFIYPSTVMKYVSDTRASPAHQLDVILGVRSARAGDIPFAEIDALYTHILSSVQDTSLMLDILALLMGIFDISRDRSSANIAWFLGVDPVEVDLVLASLVSIIDWDSKDFSVHISHASLSDFLSDKARSGNFYIDQTVYCANFLHQAVKKSCSDSGVDLDFCYIIIFAKHLPKMTDELYHDLDSFLCKFFSLETKENNFPQVDNAWNDMFDLAEHRCR